MSKSTYTVSGMTCSHCAMSVSEEIRLIDGVLDVAVDLSSGRVTVSSTDALDAEQVREAVEEAGYRLVTG